MTPVHPIETSGTARRPYDRRPNAWRRAPVFQIPGDTPVATDLAVRPAPPAQALALLTQTADEGAGIPSPDQASQTFVDNVTRVMRTPQRITGWFVDLIV
jgi:hypothetical protein